jgi:hypothetical protein
VLPHHYNSSDLSPANFFLFPKGESAIDHHHPDPGHLKKQLGTGHQYHLLLRGCRRLPPIVEQNKKFICIGDEYVEKS